MTLQSVIPLTGSNRDTVAIVLAGGKGTRLRELTDERAKPGIPFGGKFRIIDFTLSNCVNSGIRRVAVLTQYKASELIFHLQRGWSQLRWELGEYVGIVPAQQQKGESWYQGTADAVYQNIELFKQQGVKRVLILGGDHVYKMDYSRMIAHHVAMGADVTVSAILVPQHKASCFGVLQCADDSRITAFVEKPAEPPQAPGHVGKSLASMGIYVFELSVLERLLRHDACVESSKHDFGYDVIPRCIQEGKTYAYSFSEQDGPVQAYWRDVGTLDEYYQAHMDLVSVTPELNLYDEQWPIYTCQEQLPGAKFVFDDDGCRGEAQDAVVSAGCIISGATVKRSLLSSRVRVDKRSLVTDSVILPCVVIGRNCRIHKAIIADDTQIPDGFEVGIDDELDASLFTISPQGVRLVTQTMVEKWLAHRAGAVPVRRPTTERVN